MVSRRPNVSTGAVTRLSAPMALPTLIDCTANSGAAGAGAGAEASVDGAGASFFLQPGMPSTAKPRPAAQTILRDRIMRALLGPSGLGNREGLAWVDEIGILDDVLIRLVDPLPLAGAAVEVLGDLRERITFHDRVRPARRRRGGRAVAFHVTEIGLRLLVVRHGTSPDGC